MKLYIVNIALILLVLSVNSKAEYLDSYDRKVINEMPVAEWPQNIIRKLSSDHIKNAARHGNAEAMVIAANSHEYGINGYEMDFNKALYWYRKLIDTDKMPEGYMGLASMYANGKGVEKDKNLAKNNFEKASAFILRNLSGNNDRASYTKARLFALSDVLIGDTSLYANVKRKAESNGSLELIGIIDGYRYILKISGINQSDSNNFLGKKSTTMTLTDNQKIKIGDRLKYWVNLGLKRNNAPIIYSQAEILLRNDFPFGQDSNQSIKLFKKIAEECDTSIPLTERSAMKIAYFYGPKGHFRDYIQSYKWYNISSFMGDSFTDSSISELEARMSPQQIQRAQYESREWLKKYCH